MKLKNCLDCLGKKGVTNTLLFAGGIAATLVSQKNAKNGNIRKAAVNTVATGIKAKNKAKETYQSIKEDAEDIVYDAKAKVEE